MIKVERLERFTELQKRIEVNRTDPDLTDEEWDEYMDLMRQIVFDLAAYIWQDEDATGVFMALFEPAHPYELM